MASIHKKEARMLICLAVMSLLIPTAYVVEAKTKEAEVQQEIKVEEMIVSKRDDKSRNLFIERREQAIQNERKSQLQEKEERIVELAEQKAEEIERQRLIAEEQERQERAAEQARKKAIADKAAKEAAEQAVVAANVAAKTAPPKTQEVKAKSKASAPAETKAPAKAPEKKASVQNSSGRLIGTFQATAYAVGAWGVPGTVTANGTDISGTIYSPEGYRIIAVDTRVIPMNSIVEVHVPGQAPFIAKASDTGGMIKGNIIDILMSSPQQGLNFGRQNGIKIYSIR